MPISGHGRAAFSGFAFPARHPGAFSGRSRAVKAQGDRKSSRVVSGIRRISSQAVNKDFLSKDPMSKWWPPYPNNVDIRKITMGQPMRLCRMHTDPNAAGGRFLAREKAIRPLLNNPEALRK